VIVAEKSESTETEVVDRPSKATPVGPAEPVELPSVMGATFAERAKARQAAEKKAVSSASAENKAVDGDEAKSSSRRRR